MDHRDIIPFIRALGHSKPNLRVLEIGTGKGSAARDIIKALTREDGSVLCAKYTFTSTGFISGEDHEELFPNMEYATLDIGQDLAEQGWLEESRRYDLIITSNAIHATSHLHSSLANFKKLLRPGGRLLMRELCPSSSSKWINYVLGVLPAWWLGAREDDGRGQEPYVGLERWKAEFDAAGLGELEGSVLDAEAPHQLTATMVIRHGSFGKRPTSKKISVLCGRRQQLDASDQIDTAAEQQILAQLEKRGNEVTICRLSDGLPDPGLDVVSLLDLQEPFFESMDETRFQALKDLIHRLEDGRAIFWITHSSHLGCRDPRYGQVFGLARTARSELLADFTTCEVDGFDDAATAKRIVDILGKFQARGGGTREGDAGDDDADTLNPDFEWVIRDGRVHVGRFYPSHRAMSSSSRRQRRRLTSTWPRRAGSKACTGSECRGRSCSRTKSKYWSIRLVSTSGYVCAFFFLPHTKHN